MHRYMYCNIIKQKEIYIGNVVKLWFDHNMESCWVKKCEQIKDAMDNGKSKKNQKTSRTTPLKV